MCHLPHVGSSATRVKSTAADGWARTAQPFTEGKHRWHIELVTDKEGDECSTMGVCVETPGNAYVVCVGRWVHL